MKTIYDFKPTKEELKKCIPWCSSKEKYFSFGLDDDSLCMDIATLMYYRGNRIRMLYYVYKCKNINYRNQFLRTIYHPVICRK